MNPYASVNDLSQNPNFRHVTRLTVDSRSGERYYNEVYYPIGAVIEDVAIPKLESVVPAPSSASTPTRRPAMTIDPARLAAAQAWADEMRRALTTDEA